MAVEREPAAARSAGDDESAVRLDGDRSGLILPGPEIRRRPSAVAKRKVQTPIRVVSRQREILAGQVRHHEANHHDLPVWLQGHAFDPIAKEPARDLPGVPERRIETAIRIVPRERETAVDRRTRTCVLARGNARYDKLTVGLYRNSGGAVIGAEVRRHPASPPER